jgi:hypothetical protein
MSGNMWTLPASAYAYLQLIYEDSDGVQLVILALLIHLCSICAAREVGKERMARWQAFARVGGRCGRGVAGSSGGVVRR